MHFIKLILAENSYSKKIKYHCKILNKDSDHRTLEWDSDNLI